MRQRYSNLVAASLTRLERYYPNRAQGLFSLIGLVSAAFGIGVLITAGFLKHQTEPAGMFTNFVSSLGWGGNGSHEIFRLGLTMLAFMILPYVLFLVFMLRLHAEDHQQQQIHELTHQSAGAWYIAAFGLCVLAWWVDIRVPDLSNALVILLIHTIGAALFFVFALIGANKLTTAMALHGMPNKTQQWLVRVTVFNAIAMAASILPLIAVSHSAGLFDELYSSGADFLVAPEQRVAWIKSVTGNYPWIAFFEWATVFSLLGWVSVTAIQTYRHLVPAVSIEDQPLLKRH